jgi:hypothetical protein
VSRRTREQLWQVRANNSWWTCQIRFVGESYGWMVSIDRDGSTFGGHRHLLRGDAERWADQMREQCEKGWPE